MRTYYYALNKSKEYVFDNFPTEAKGLIYEHSHSNNVFEININGEDRKARIGCKQSEFGSIYVLTTESKFINRKKFFNELVELSTIALKPAVNFQNDLINSHSEENEEFIHNVTSLNTYSIQDLFALIPQNILTKNINTQTDKVKDIIKDKPNVTAETLLNLIKYNLATKVEISVFERTLKPSSFVSKSAFPIRPILLSILQIFIRDFENVRIEVSLDASEKSLSIDYDSLFVSLFYLMDNSIKYCCPITKYKIIFKQEGDSFSILFVMISIKISDSDLKRITTRGFRSETAQKLNVDGNGIGMYRILKTLKLNDAKLTITPKCNDYTKRLKDIDYEANEFKITFNNQKEWFK
tara:strand:- start:18671 stop:19729 length:1059 start_codon:yes stop_codon:yes gene_type:complete